MQTYSWPETEAMQNYTEHRVFECALFCVGVSEESVTEEIQNKLEVILARLLKGTCTAAHN